MQRENKNKYHLLTYSMEQGPSFEANQQTLQIVKKFPAFMEPKSPSPYPQVPATCPYPDSTITFSVLFEVKRLRKYFVSEYIFVYGLIQLNLHKNKFYTQL